MLESDYDGCGCWSLPPGATVIGPVYNTTFTSLLKLSEGGYGGRTLQDGHTIIAVNSEWTAGKDIGQFWERYDKAGFGQVPVVIDTQIKGFVEGSVIMNSRT